MCCARTATTRSSALAAEWMWYAHWPNGSPSVTGIEINPIIANTIMRGRYADYVYHLYEQARSAHPRH